MKVEKNSLMEDILVLDLADERGSFCSKLLANLGAQVIKVEKPEGDPSRSSIPLFFAYHNMNKLSLTCDLDRQEGRRFFRRLVKKADVLVETFPRGYLHALRLSFGFLNRINPGLIHISISGFGQTGPRRHYRSCDSVASAFGGQMFVSGTSSGPPVKLPGLQSYYAASLFGAVAILLTLRERRLTGKGRHMDLSTQEAVASTLDHVMVDYFYDRKVTRRQGNIYGNRLFRILPCKDGFIQITILQNWETLLELMASEGMAEDLLEEKWQQQIYREEHFEHIMGVVGRWTRGHTKAELFELGQAMRFPWASVDSAKEVLKSPQLAARKFFIEAELPEDGPVISLPGIPYKFSTSLPPLPKSAPSLGEHTRQILEKLGVGQRRIEKLAKMKVI